MHAGSSFNASFKTSAAFCAVSIMSSFLNAVLSDQRETFVANKTVRSTHRHPRNRRIIEVGPKIEMDRMAHDNSKIGLAIRTMLAVNGRSLRDLPNGFHHALESE